MQRYQIIKVLGDGSFGTVSLAIHSMTSEKVAIKKMKKRYSTWEECMQLREVKSLKKLLHPSIIKLKEVIRENERLYFVFEYAEENLYQSMKAKNQNHQSFTELEIRWVIYQVLQGLAYMHKHGYFHRDIKPENLLMQSHQGLITKIADFGLARELRSRPPYTEYISTRWYRAPEVILHSTHYSSPIDLWALGCILAEMYLLQPLFPGTSEIDQLYKITQCLGPIQATQWKEGWMLVNQLKFRCPSSSSSSSVRFPTPLHSKAGFSFITNLIVYDPSKRLTAPQALRDPYFKDAPEFSSLVLDHDYILVGGRSPLEWKADPPSPVPALSPYSPSLFSHALPSKVSAINTSLPPLLAPRTSPPLSSATLPSPSLPTPHSSSHPNHAMFALPPLSPISHQRLDALLSDLETSPIHPKPALTFKKSPIKAVTSTATTSTERRSSHTFPKVNQSYFSGFKRFWHR